MKTKIIVKILGRCLWMISLLPLTVTAQVIDVSPTTPTVNDSVNVTFHVDQCSCNLSGYTGDIYAHTGLITTASTDQNDWKYVIAAWNVNLSKAKLQKINSTTYELHIKPDVTSYYGIDSTVDVTKLAFVFRSSDGSKQTSNIYQQVYKPGLSVHLTKPSGNQVVKQNDTIAIAAGTVALGTPNPDSISLYIDDTLVFSSFADTLSYNKVVTGSGTHWIKVTAANSQYHVADSIYYFVRSDITTAALPSGLKDGINYIDSSTVTLVLYAPYKNNVMVLGDFNNWTLSNTYLMNRTPDSSRYWLTITGLEKNKEYAFQYLVDGNLRIADPYTDKILDPANDPYISSATYPNLKPYPTGKTTGIVSVLQTSQPAYNWQVTNFTPPKTTDLVIYELLVRDFTPEGNFKAIMDTLNYLKRLGVNAIELMPVNEFEGNSSWGYNPSFYFAVDKAYGTKNDFKALIDACHKDSMAVIMDMVLNHSYGQCPLVQLYYDANTMQTTAQNPWYNQVCPHQPYCWGYDFNHESLATKAFVTRVNRYWLNQYHVDGYRFDFTKGFTNKVGDGWYYDSSRVAILEAMYDSIVAFKSNAIVIFEQLSANPEETELANHGILLWGKMTDQYNEATMGYNTPPKSDFSAVSYKNRGWNDPHLVGYMESHDEERLMYKNITWGNSSGSYDVKNVNTALHRMEAAATLFFTVPGPKMLYQWGELGYDYSINRCTNGTVDPNGGCRLDPKPLGWSFYSDPNRYHLYQVFSSLIKLREHNSLFETTDFSLSVAASTKTIHLNSSSENATILGNFDLTSKDIDPAFQHTGTWYEYFSGTSIDVTDVHSTITLGPGDYRLYTDVQLAKPDIKPLAIHSISANGNYTLLYPNPTKDRFTLVPAETGKLDLAIYNPSGDQVYHYNGYAENGTALSLDPSLPAGFYLYVVKINTSLSQGKLIIK